MPGEFHNFRLDYSRATGDANAQAVAILSAVRQLHEAGAPQVGITYSANGNQTKAIRAAYAASNWKTNTNGANQARVMTEVESLLATATYSDLQGVFRIIPITTMTYQTDDPCNEVRADIAAARTFIVGGGHILGWKNQDTTAKDTYAIGGGVTQLIRTVVPIIKTGLMTFKANFPGDDIDGNALKKSSVTVSTTPSAFYGSTTASAAASSTAVTSTTTASTAAGDGAGRPLLEGGEEREKKSPAAGLPFDVVLVANTTYSSTHFCKTTISP